MKRLDLSGNWMYRTDYDDRGISEEYYKDRFDSEAFVLPGSACENGIGKKQEYYDELSKEAVRAPREKYEYIAPLWLQKEVDIPKELEGRSVKLFLERVNIASELWIDGIKTERQIIALSTPHIYDVTDKITAGKHIFTLRIDNRNLLNIDIMASGYSIDTQGYWNGIIGKIELQAEEKTRIEDIRVYPDETGIKVRITELSETYSPCEQSKAEITLEVLDPDGASLGERSFERKLFNSRQPDYFRYDIDAPRYWNEFHPELYTLVVKYSCNGMTDSKKVSFGIRTIRSENKKLLLNGKQISLRGTIDCAQYPLTGYPPMDIDIWRKNFRIIKSYGLNHVRFHAWCPPECAFEAADEVGLYVSVEMPLWLNKDVCALEFGDDPIHREYYPSEAIRISDTYGNHPSFIMFSNGNENMGDFSLLEQITICTKAYDNRRLYTITSNFDHPVLPCEDYFCAFEANGNRIRLQTRHDEAGKSTCVDYSKAVNEMSVPIISFEVGQYCVYPDVDICERYTGNILPTNFDAIRKSMKKKGVYHRLKDYIAASGDLAVKLYKEDMEAALRTKNFGGIELLSLIDYTGQSTATVGILDVFYESKSLSGAEEWRNFCGSVVPLFKAKRIFTNTENMEAELDLYDFGDTKTEDPVFDIKIYNGNDIFYENKTSENKISVPLCDVKEPSLLNVEVTVEGHRNTWRIFVFAEEKKNKELRMIKTQEELDKVIKEGGKAAVSVELFKNPKKGSFIPVFWSPVHFPTPKPCGAIINAEHPIFKNFPTEKYLDYQWKPLMENSVSEELSIYGDSVKPIVEVVPNFVDNIPTSPLFEVKIGKAELVFCGFDLSVDDVAVQALRNALAEYING